MLGLSVLHHGAPGLGTVAAFFLANIPEALSSSAGMRRAKLSARYVFGVWVGIALMISFASAVAGLSLLGTEAEVRGDGRGVCGRRDPCAGLGNDDPGGVPRLAAVQWPAAGRWFCGLTDPAGTQPLKSLPKLQTHRNE